MDDQQRRRYHRQIVLPQVGEAGQQRLLQARALIVGLGGLGSPAALYLAGAGVGHLVIADYDRIEESNLHRQVIHRSADLGEAKADSARARLLELNPRIEVVAVNGHLDDDELLEEVARAAVVLDCTDNLPTRFEVNEACFRAGTPLVSGAAIRLEGQVSVFDPTDPRCPCYRCLYREADGAPDDTCSRVGVLGPVVGIVGCAQALEAIKLIAGFGEPLRGRVTLLDGATMQWHTFTLPRDPACPVCARR